MKDDTILFVFGDHGMTRTGDHGGDSSDELEAGLFIYSPAQIVPSHKIQKSGEKVAQTDFVPTLSLLLGVPIPFSNLGMVITDLFNHCPWWKTSTNELKQVYHTIKALRLNAQQINHYLDSYAVVSMDFPYDKFKKLKDLLFYAENDLQGLLTAMVAEGETTDVLRRFKILEDHYKTYISGVRDMCRSVWAKFDVISIILGIFTFAIGFFINVLFLSSWTENESDLPASFIFVPIATVLYIVYTSIQSLYLSEFVNPLMLFLYGIVFMFVLIILIKNSSGNLKGRNQGKLFSPQKFSSDGVFACFICTFYFMMYFSNSFVVLEDSVSLFFTQTMVYVYGVKMIFINMESAVLVKTCKESTGHRHPKVKSHFDLFRVVTHPSCVTLLVTLLCSTCLRLSTVFRACREEQWYCNATIFLQPLGNLTDDAVRYRNMRYFFSILCLFVFVFSMRSWMKHYGNLNGFSPSILCAKFAYPIAALCCALHWAIQGLPQNILDSLPIWQQVIMAQLVYGSLVASFVSLLLLPLCVYELKTKTDCSISVPFSDKLRTYMIPKVYSEIKHRWHQEKFDENEEEKAPVVYGLGSVYSAGFVHLLMGVGLLLALLLGDGLAPAILLMLLSGYFILELYTAGHSDQGQDSALHPVPWSAIVTLGSVTAVFFFATGHQATVPKIRWEAAFNGFHGDFDSYILAGFLIAVNTFASQVFVTMLAPLFLIWPHLGGALSQSMTKTSESEKPWTGDFVASDNRLSFRRNLFKLALGVALFAAIKVLGAMCAAGLHRRHLMVWKIFAPRFVFEAAAMIVTFIVLNLVYLFALRIDSAVEKFVQTLER